jgi:hypothetical protein
MDMAKEMNRQIDIAVYRADDEEGNYWVLIEADGKPYDQLGPFNTATERDACRDDLIKTFEEIRNSRN